LICTATLSFAEAPDRIAGAINSSKMVPLPSQVQHRARPQYDQGRVDGSFQLNGVKLFLVPSPSQVKALKQLLEEQQDPKSPNFHKWLTIQQYADRFGLSHNDVQKTTAWLKSQGLTGVKVANGRDWINFSGTASQIESAFRTEIHRYKVNGEMHFANSTPPSVPAALSGIANGFLGLDDFRPKPMIKKAVPRERRARPAYYYANTGLADFIAPNDIATIYDLGPLYTAGIDGTGEKLLIVGQTDVYLADLVNFRLGFSLPAIYSGCAANGSGVLTSCTTSSTANFQYILDPDGGGDPGVSLNDLSEADLDLEWSAATARGAQIIFYNSTNVFTSLLDAIDNATLLAPVISISYGECEWFLGGGILTTGGPGQLETGMMEANSLGITILNSSGDSGAAECDPPPSTEPPDTNNIAMWGLAVSYPASSPEVTGVGGTAIVYPTGFSSTYWGTDDTSNDGGTAISYPPETAWNDDVELPLAGYGGTALSWQETYNVVQSGGGVSNCALQNDPTDNLCTQGFPVPSWQSGLVFPTAPPTTGRYSPDVSLLASPNFPGYVYCTPLEELATGTTDDNSTTSSCATGIASAVNGVVSGTSYVVDPSIVGGTSASAPVFAGIVTMLNQYLNTSASSPPGLGNINPMLYQLAATSPSPFHQVVTGENMVYCSGDTPNPNFEISTSYLCPGTTGEQEIFGWQASNADPTTGYNLVTGLGSVDANALFTAWNASTTQPPVFTLSVGTNSLQVTPGQTGTATITVTVTSGTPPDLTFTCSEASAPALSASGSVCTVSPATPTNAGSVSLQIPTFAPTAQLRRPLGSSRGIFFASLLPGLFGIIFTAGSRKRTARGLRYLSLIVVLGFSTLWLSSCSSNSSSTRNPGTPAGSYSVSVTASTGGANPVTASTTVTLVVQ
jgi:subtilase family serine protease